MKWVKTVAVFVVLVVALAFLIAFFKQCWWWVEVHTGTVNESGPYYGFFSGFGSDLQEAAILAAIWTGARHLNCREKRCPRITLHTMEDPETHVKYRVCPKHHPLIPDEHSHHGFFKNHFSKEHLDTVRDRVIADCAIRRDPREVDAQ